MDDLLGEDWQQPAKVIQTAPLNANAYTTTSNAFRTGITSNSSGAASPLNISRPSSTVNGNKSKPNDSFSSLLNLKAQKPGAALSMQERQRQILEERRKQQQEQAQLWDNLGSGRGTPEVRQPSPAGIGQQDDEDDILAAFNKDAPVNKASHFTPPPSSTTVSGSTTPAQTLSRMTSVPDQTSFDNADDDPFGLGNLPQRTNDRTDRPQHSRTDSDFDILGDLGKPVASKPPPQPQPPSSSSSDDDDDYVQRRQGSREQPQDHNLAELVDMGFPVDTARIALSETGGNVQDAVGWLLQQAHEESRQKAREQSRSDNRRQGYSRSPQPEQRTDRDRPPFDGRDGRSHSASRWQTTSNSSHGEKDSAQVAQELGTKFLKSAGSLWKASQKQMAKTLSEFQNDGDQSQPKWLREGSNESSRASSQRPVDRSTAPRQATMNVTDEAAMLDAPREKSRDASRRQAQQHINPDLSSRPRAPAETNARQGQQARTTPPAGFQDRRPASKLSRRENEEQTAQAYISPARRKRTVPKSEPEVDLFSNAPPKPTDTKLAERPANGAWNFDTQPSRNAVQTRVPPNATRTTPRPQVPARSIPSISPSALRSSAAHRKAGGEHFKRGDFAAAHESYTAALTPLPPTHPVIIVVLCNHALTALKTGDAKTAVLDADRALEVIGPGLGANEVIDLGPGEGTKDMKEFYGKAIMRKAEALEHLERYVDAAAVWRLAVEAGVGGVISARGRDRCEKATSPKQVSTAAPATRGPPRPTASRSAIKSRQSPAPAAAAYSAEAVQKLRQANAAAERADDEKFALTDQVDAKLAAWRGGKTDNLRALLQSMDAVLWESAGWKQVGMSDLIIPNKVKIVYMKAIAKVHPDKIPQDATTEQRMISGAVFSTLNEAWDKFKKDNNL